MMCAAPHFIVCSTDQWASLLNRLTCKYLKINATTSRFVLVWIWNNKFSQRKGGCKTKTNRPSDNTYFLWCWTAQCIVHLAHGQCTFKQTICACFISWIKQACNAVVRWSKIHVCFYNVQPNSMFTFCVNARIASLCLLICSIRTLHTTAQTPNCGSMGTEFLHCCQTQQPISTCLHFAWFEHKETHRALTQHRTHPRFQNFQWNATPKHCQLLAHISGKHTTARIV